MVHHERSLLSERIYTTDTERQLIDMNKLFSISVLLALILAGSGCIDTNGNGSADVVKEGDHVLVDYTGRLENGTVFDTSVEDVAIEAGVHNPNRAYQPIEFTVGAGQMIKGFDNGVVGMAVGEERTLTIPPEDAYKNRREDLVKTVPIEDLSAAGITPAIGERLTTSYGPGIITNVTNTSVVIDFNHKLAGETLIFDVKLVSIGGERAITEEDLESDTEDTMSDTVKTAVKENRTAIIETSMGTMTAELYGDRAPNTTANFLELAESGFYDGLIFHRVKDDFMIQGGDPKGDGTGGSGKTIKLEIHPELTHVDCALAMARSQNPDSASSQFYICDGAQHFLDGNYAVFGKVVDGMDAVRAIAAVETDPRDRPLEDVVIIKISTRK
uniref:peptidylprolyl isomerase n=1 Tax=Candidatus Methanogaster sp. ANME-2c ERB4 TaxID=2759911 RepID=A0A7G9YMC9_9EURY|nr:trigger factor [Methanosarcinales archaeon ANME-2c ERB4]